MGSGKRENRSQMSATLKNPKNRKQLPLGPNRAKIKSKKIKLNRTKNSISNEIESKSKNNRNNDGNNKVKPATASQQLHFFLDQYQSANGIQLSSLELEAIKDTCILDLPQDLAQEVSNLGEHMKAAFGPSWKEVLCEKQIREGKMDPGNPAVLIISLSALRSLELLRGLQPLTRECHAAKLFSKHMKIEDQVSVLKNRVNIASGTPSRIKKLIDMEALGLPRLSALVLDMHTDVKGYSLFTLPQVRDEFWDLYKSYFHQQLVQGRVRVCLYGPVPISFATKEKVDDH